MLSTGCSHVLVLDEGRYQVRVSPLTAKAHVFEEINSDGIVLLLDRAVVPYEIRGDWKAVWGADIPGIPSVAYNNIMATAFARPKDKRSAFALSESKSFNNRDMLLANLPQSPWLKASGFVCGPSRPEAILDLEGVVFDCKATRLGESQLMRMRALIGSDGIFLQIVTWTSGSRMEQAANEFWNSVQLSPSATQAPANQPIAIAQLPLDTLLKKTLGFQ